MGTKAFFRLDNNRSDVLRSRWRPYARARPPYQSLIVEPLCYELVPCPNQLRVKESFTERDQRTEGDVFRTTREDNDVSLSCEDRKFLEIMGANIHKNDHGKWEMPLPFRHKDVRMPNNRSQAVNRLNGLIRTLRR